jgi:hypothetical protein
MIDEELFDYILDDMRIEGPHSFEELEDLISIINDIVKGLRGGDHG